MKSLLILALALTINTNVMAQEPATTPVAPTPMENTPAAAHAADGKELVDQNHKPESAFEGHDKASKKEMKKNKKKIKKGKKHSSKKSRKNKKKQA
jgi:hypothetical protein